MLIIGYFFPQKAYQEVYTEQVDIKPWSLTKPVAVLITLGSVSMYTFLAQNIAPWIMTSYYIAASIAIIYVLWSIIQTLRYAPCNQ